MPRIQCPTLIVQGEEDQFTLPEHASFLHQAIQGSELAFFPDAGHEVQREQPRAFNQRVLEFWTSLP